MSKHDVLIQDDIDHTTFSPSLLQEFEEYCKSRGLQKSELKILDYGSGRGASVAILRQNGYDAYGCEIDQIPYDNGCEYFENLGLNHAALFHMIGDDCDTGFEDGFFEVVFSEQVLEHVQPIEQVIDEISRITKTEGLHIHAFPAKYSIFEPHLLMPFIHWLPKNIMMRLLMYFWIAYGKDPDWPPMKGMGSWEKSKLYFEYSRDKTYYRNIRLYRRLYVKNSFCFSHILKRSKRRATLWGLFPDSVSIKATKD